jgi:hypothetical protein
MTHPTICFSGRPAIYQYLYSLFIQFADSHLVPSRRLIGWAFAQRAYQELLAAFSRFRYFCRVSACWPLQFQRARKLLPLLDTCIMFPSSTRRQVLRASHPSCHSIQNSSTYEVAPPLLRACVRGQVSLCFAAAPSRTHKPPHMPPPSHHCFSAHAESQCLAWRQSEHASGAS